MSPSTVDSTLLSLIPRASRYRPVLLLLRAWTGGAVGRNIVIAWNGDGKVSFEIDGDASPEQLAKIVMQSKARSAVYDILTNGVPVSVAVKTPAIA